MTRILEAFRSTEQVMLAEAMRELLARHLPEERAAAADAEMRFERDTWRALGDAGFLGLGIAEELGGSGGGVSELAIVTREIARVLPSLAVDYVLCGMVGRTLVEAGGKHLELLPAMVSGEKIYAYGLSEPGGGSDLLSLRTRASLVDGAWSIQGQKLWISMARESDLIFTLCRTDDPEPGRSRASGLSLIAVPSPQPGVVSRKVELAIMRAAGTCEVFFDDARAPEDAVVGERGRGLAALRVTLDVERIMSAAISLGIGYGALDLALDYTGKRDAFGGPIARFQAVQHPLAESASELVASALLVEHAAAAIDAGLPASQESAMAKLVTAEAVHRLVDRSARAMGGMGIAAEGKMQRYLRDARLQLFSPVNNDLVKSIIAESLGMPRSY